MKLYFSPTSPFVRKVRLAAEALGLTEQIELVPTDVYTNISLYKNINPLIKIPALETKSGEILTNSPFICQYLASLKPGTTFWPQGDQLWKALQFQSIADGGMEAAVLRRYESLRSPDKFDSKFDYRQKEKILNALEYLQNHLPQLSTENLGIAEVSTISFIDYLHLRYANEKLQDLFPRIFEWAKKWNEKPGVMISSPISPQHK